MNLAIEFGYNPEVLELNTITSYSTEMFLEAFICPHSQISKIYIFDLVHLLVYFKTISLLVSYFCMFINMNIRKAVEQLYIQKVLLA